jgi:endonuclease/exonuclease/phosphatase (EEP) superfamily protein YafD
MKKYILLTLVLFIFSAITVVAQDNTQAIQTELQQWQQTYNLDTDQQTVVKTILAHKYENLTELAIIKDAEPVIYQEKLLTVEKQTRMAVKSILTEQQLLIYEKEEIVRMQKIKKRIVEMEAAEPAEKKEKLSKAVKEMDY